MYSEYERLSFLMSKSYGAPRPASSAEDTTELPIVRAKKQKKQKIRKKRHVSIFAILSFLVGVALLGVGAKMMVPDFLSLNDFRNLSDSVKNDSDDDSESDSKADSDTEKDKTDKESTEDNSEANSSSESSTDTSEDTYSINWDALRSESEDSVAWISVDNTDIDFPVVQGDDNWWYLYHDIFGRDSYASVFLDYRSDPNGMNDIIYAHTHWANTGFHQIAEVDEQWHLDEVGTVRYSTPEVGMTEYVPIAGMTVWPQFEDAQEFEFEPSQADLDAMYLGILSKHASDGDWNFMTMKDEPVPWSDTEAIKVTGSKPDVDYWWRITEQDKKTCYEDAKMMVFRDWLRQLCGSASATRYDMNEQIDKAERCLVLACCSWPYDSHRTLLVCVH